MNTNLLSFVDERIKKFLSKLNLLKYKPAVVQRVDVDNVKIKFDDGTIVDLPNLSGNFVLPNTVVLVYYWGNVINKNTAYIGKNTTSVVVCDSTEYDAKDSVLYFLKDTGEIYIGNRSYGNQNQCDSDIHIICDTSLTGNIISCDFKVLSENLQNISFFGDVLMYSEETQITEIKYFLDGKELDFCPKISVNGYVTQHLNTFFSAELGEHNFKVTINTDIIEKIQGQIIGQNIVLIEAKPTTANDYIYTIENDKVRLIYYKGAEKRIQIPSEIEGKPVTEIESTCFTSRGIKYAIIPDTVTKIY